MDAANPFETPTTYKLHRAEYLVGFLIATGLIIWHLGDIRWVPAVALFLYIDIIGYIPGAIAFKKAKGGQISKAYYVLYNTMHSLITQTIVVLAWGFLIKWEWALLVIPFHVFGDRGRFGHFLKPFDLPFEPVANPGYKRLIESLKSQPPASEPITDAVVATPTPAAAK